MTEDNHQAVGAVKFVHQLQECKSAQTAPELVQAFAGIVIGFRIALKGKKGLCSKVACTVTETGKHYIIGDSVPGLTEYLLSKGAVNGISMGQYVIPNLFDARAT